MIYHLPKSSKLAVLIVLVAQITIIFTNSGMAFDEVNQTFFGVAIKGYDTAAYHTEGRAPSICKRHLPSPAHVMFI